MVKQRDRRVHRTPAPTPGSTVTRWPSAHDIPQRITDWSVPSHRLDQRANDNVGVRGIETLYSIGDVQERWGVSDTTIYRQIRAGKLLATKVGGQWRISESAMATYLKSNEPLLRLPGHPPRSRRSS